MRDHTLSGGFADAPRESARAFRGLMNAIARPGTVETVVGAAPPAPMSGAAGVLALTLLDDTTPIYLAGALDCPPIRDWLTFHTGAPFVSADTCLFAFGRWEALSPITQFAIGSAEYPDRSATLVVEMSRICQSGTQLRGPGIKESAALNLPEPAAFHRNAMLFPLGLDFYFTSGSTVAALPRSTKLEVL